MSALEGRSALLDAAPHISISSMEIVADSTLGTVSSRPRWAVLSLGEPERLGFRPGAETLPMVWRLEPDGRWRIAREMLNEDV